MNYGEILDPQFDLRKEEIYPLFVEYFNNPVMTKIKDVNGYSMYVAKNYSLLAVEYRYIIVFTKQNNYPVFSTIPLEKIKWISLQTRTMTDEHKLPSHSYIPRRIPQLDQKIILSKRLPDQFIYQVEKLPISIILLPKTKNMDYNPTGSVVTALETYQTIVNFI